MIKKYRKKPIAIEAIQYTGENLEEVKAFCPIAEIVQMVKFGIKVLKDEGFTKDQYKGYKLCISTLEGDMEVSVGDYVIKGIQGEFYPCKPDIFEQTYEEVEE